MFAVNHLKERTSCTGSSADHVSRCRAAALVRQTGFHILTQTPVPPCLGLNNSLEAGLYVLIHQPYYPISINLLSTYISYQLALLFNSDSFSFQQMAFISQIKTLSRQCVSHVMYSVQAAFPKEHLDKQLEQLELSCLSTLIYPILILYIITCLLI